MWQRLSAVEGDSRNAISTEEKRFSDSKRNANDQHDSGIIDSGFLSSDNLLSSGEYVRDDEDDKKSKEIGDGTHRESSIESHAYDSRDFHCDAVALERINCVDSGLEDVGLSESLGQMSLEKMRVTNFGGKVQLEPTVELMPVKALESRDPNEAGHIFYESERQHSDFASNTRQPEPWEIYYTQDDDGDTQLHVAIVQGFLEAAFSLIRMTPHPCLLNILNDDCQAPLHLAILTRQSRIARRLILAGADLTTRDFRGNTALHLACFSGDLGCVRALTDPLSPIERNFLSNSTRIPALPQDLEQRNYDGEMCLHVAASNGQVDLVQHLLRLGADLEAREGLCGRTALHLALERGCRSVVNFLLQECQPCLDAPTYGGLTAYQIAICLDRQLARELVKYGAKPEPLPETDPEFSDDSDDEGASYMSPAMAMLRQGVGVRA